MEVIIHSNVTGLLGTTVISTDPEQTVGQLIRAFCVDKGIHNRLDFVLTNCRQEVLNKRQKIAHYDVRNGEELYLSLKEPSDEWPCGCNQWYVLSAVTFLIGAVGLVALCVLQSSSHAPKDSYGVGLDAGSSHTSLFVFKWPARKMNGTGVIEQVLKCPAKSQIQRPISFFVDDPSKAGPDLKPCLDKAKDVVPAEQLSATPVFLGATAGMRLLHAANESVAEAIMTSVRNTIATYPFLFERRQQQVRILTGREEGTFSWIATNYLSGNFGFQPLATIDKPPTQLSANQHQRKSLGALDMGGASTQITFVPEKPATMERGYNQSVRLYGVHYEMYSYSYQCYGLNEAYRRYLAHLVQMSNYSHSIQDPCGQANSVTNRSYEQIFRVLCTSLSRPHTKGERFSFVGVDNMTACHAVARQLFNMSAPCHHSSCSFNGTYQPPLFGHFVGFSGFYYAMNNLNLTKKSTFDQFTAAVKNCNKILRHAQNYTNCFEVQFVYVLLVEGYGFNMTNWASLDVKMKLNGVEVGWILGMMINMTNVVPVPTSIEPLSLTVFIALNVLFAIFLVLSVAFLFHACKRRRLLYEVVPAMTTYGAI